MSNDEKQTHAERLAEAYAEQEIQRPDGSIGFCPDCTKAAFIAGHDAALRSPVIRAMAEALDAAEDALRLIYHRHSDDMRTAKLASNNAEKVRLALAEFAAMEGK